MTHAIAEPTPVTVFLEGVTMGALVPDWSPPHWSPPFRSVEVRAAADAPRLEHLLRKLLRLDANDQFVARWLSGAPYAPPGEADVLIRAVHTHLPTDGEDVRQLAKRVADGEVPVAYMAHCRSTGDVEQVVAAILELPSIRH